MSVLEQLTEARSFEMLPDPDLSSGFSRRWAPPQKLAEGHEDGFIAEDDFVITTKHFKMFKDCCEAETGTGRVVFLYHLSGRRTHQLSTGESFVLTTPSFVVYRQPERVSKKSYWRAGEEELSVGLGFDPSAPPSPVGISSLENAFMNELLSGSPGEFRWLALPLEPMIGSVARSMMFSNVDDVLLHAYLAAKASELLCLSLNQLLAFSKSSVEGLSLGCRLAQIKSTLETDLQSDVSLVELAEKYALPKRRLNSLFESVYGISIKDYSSIVRMERSVYLLTHTNMRLKQIAFEVGYGHASNFCFAFKRHFGETPKSVRIRNNGHQLH